MSVEQLEERVRHLSQEELQRFAEWWEAYRESALLPPPTVHEAPPDNESEAVKQELLARRREYEEHPERFIRFKNEDELDRYFEEIRREVAARVSSARQR